jgi:hypothetical protein
MEPKDFLIEEYRELNAEIKMFREDYTRLERQPFGGVVIVYGFLALNIEKIPIEAWWSIPVLIGFAATRCSAYYFVINKRIAVYIESLENELYCSKFPGYQHFISRFRFGRNANMLFNLAGWAALIGGSILAAIWRTWIFCGLPSIHH